VMMVKREKYHSLTLYILNSAIKNN
jgi:hypothetical protein